jgi:hypothetical protein
VAISVLIGALVHKWVEGCSASWLPIAYAVVTLSATIIRLIDFKKSYDPSEISISQNALERIGALDNQYEYDRRVKWLKFKWIFLLAFLIVASVVVDMNFMELICDGNLSYDHVENEVMNAVEYLGK